MGDKLKAMLDKRGIKQGDFAKEMGISEAFVTYMIHGYKMPSVALLKRMADFFQVPIDDLV